MTQAELAADDFTKGFISLIENGRTRVSLRAAEILARRVGVSVSDLFSPTTSSERELEFALLRAEQTLTEGKPKDALALAEQAEREASGLLRARFRRLRARALIETSRSRESVRLLEEALQTFRRLGVVELEARTMFDLARAHARLDAPGEGLRLALACERAIEAGKVVDATLELELQRFLANTFVRLGDHASADLRAERALALAQDVADPAALAKLYAGLAITRHEQGDQEAALVYARRSLDLYQQLNQETAVAETWNNLAWLFLQRKQYLKAEEALGKAERLARESSNGRVEAWVLFTRAELALARGRFADAVALSDQSATHPDVPALCRAQVLLVKAQALAKQGAPFGKVKAAYEAAIDAHKGQPARLRAKAHEAYAEALAARGQVKDAYAQSRLALAATRPSAT